MDFDGQVYLENSLSAVLRKCRPKPWWVIDLYVILTFENYQIGDSYSRLFSCLVLNVCTVENRVNQHNQERLSQFFAVNFYEVIHHFWILKQIPLRAQHVVVELSAWRQSIWQPIIRAGPMSSKHSSVSLPCNDALRWGFSRSKWFFNPVVWPKLSTAGPRFNSDHVISWKLSWKSSVLKSIFAWLRNL